MAKKITSAKLKETIFSVRSTYQKIEIVETENLGKALFLDDIEQFTEADEQKYHETMTKIPFTIMPKPNKVLVLGGGDGGIIRECLKLGTNEVHLCEIDEEVISVCNRFFPNMGINYNDGRVKVFLKDAKEFVSQSKEKYDMVLVDSTDPVGASIPLFGDQFYQNIKNITTEGSLVVSQVEQMGIEKKWCEKLFNIFYKNFNHTRFFYFDYNRDGKKQTNLFSINSDLPIDSFDSETEKYFELDESAYMELIPMLRKMDYLNK